MNNSVPTSPEEWRQYWQAKGFPWRTEPEINEKRQEELAERRLIPPDMEQGVYPFKSLEQKLSRADIEWLLATHENGRGPVNWNDVSQREHEGLDLRGADLSGGLRLQGLPLSRLHGGFLPLEMPVKVPKQAGARPVVEVEVPETPKEAEERKEKEEQAAMLLMRADLSKAHLEGAMLMKAHLEGAMLVGTHLARANLSGAHLEGAILLTKAYLARADLSGAHLEGAMLKGAHLEGAMLMKAHLQGADLSGVSLERADLTSAQLQGANLSRASLGKTALNDITLADNNHEDPQVADIQWGETNLTVVDWAQIAILGDEHRVYQKQMSDETKKEMARRLDEYKKAVRANRQLAVVLQDQGLNEDASRFAYRAQVLQRKVLWKQRSFWKWLGSAILALLAGYGYRMWRILVAYLIIVSVCAGAYFVLGMYYETHLSFLDALLTSITAFHGRVFSEPFLHPGAPQLWVTAFEAIMGLVIEGVFIAMLTQKFFGK